MNQNPLKYTFSNENFINCLENIQGSKDQLNVTKDCIDDILKLLDTLKILYPLLTLFDKKRFSRFMTKIKTQLRKTNDNKSDEAEFSYQDEHLQEETI